MQEWVICTATNGVDCGSEEKLSFGYYVTMVVVVLSCGENPKPGTAAELGDFPPESLLTLAQAHWGRLRFA